MEQVVTVLDKQKPAPEHASLVEVGPRCCLNPIKIFAGSFGGPVIFDNPDFVSPNTVRSRSPTRQNYAAVALLVSLWQHLLPQATADFKVEILRH